MNARDFVILLENNPHLETPVSVGAGVFFFLGCAVFFPFAITWVVGCFLFYKAKKSDVADERAQ